MKRIAFATALALVLLAAATVGAATPAVGAPTSADTSSPAIAGPSLPGPSPDQSEPSTPVRAGTIESTPPSVPLLPATIPESVIPPDDRTRVSGSTILTSPWRWVAQLVIIGQSGSTCEAGCQCTGFLIGPRALITAGHCLYSADIGGWPVSVRIAPAKDGASEPFGAQVETSDFWSTYAWVTSGDSEYDYGAIILDDSFTGLLGAFSYGDGAQVSQVARLSGYPGEHGGEQWWDDDVITNVAAHIVSYEIDTTGGQSGSPVWYPATSANPEVIAVHDYGAPSSACNTDDNCGVRVEDTVIANFAFWRSQTSVGGIQGLPDTTAAALDPADSSNTSSPPFAGIAGAAAATVLAITGGAWYTRRRLLR